MTRVDNNWVQQQIQLSETRLSKVPPAQRQAITSFVTRSSAAESQTPVTTPAGTRR